MPYIRKPSFNDEESNPKDQFISSPIIHYQNNNELIEEELP